MLHGVNHLVEFENDLLSTSTLDTNCRVWVFQSTFPSDTCKFGESPNPSSGSVVC